MWRIARGAGGLDINSSYAYLLWCRDFAETSAVARANGAVVGFATGYVRPTAPGTLVIWQVAVEKSQRAKGVASMLLDDVLRRIGPACLETTITQNNHASIGLFTRLASRWGAKLTRSPLFESSQFPDAHATEDLFVIGSFASAREPASPESRLPGIRAHGPSTGEL